jgi:hypothetical protein
MERKPKVNFIEVVNNIKGVVWLIFLIAGIGGSFSISQYRIGELQQQVGELKGSEKDIAILQADSKNTAISINEIKETQKQIYTILLDISSNSRANGKGH